MTKDIYEIKNKICSKIIGLRKYRGISQRELAHLSGVQPETINRIEKNGSNLTLDNLLRISEALQVNSSSLLNEDIDAEAFKISELLSEIPEPIRPKIYEEIEFKISIIREILKQV